MANSNEASSPDTFNNLMESIKTGDVTLTEKSSDLPASSEVEADSESSVIDKWNEFKAGEEGESSPIDEEVTEESETEESPSEDASLSLDDVGEDSEAKESDSAIEEVTITDAKGRRKVKVDFSNKDKMRKYVQYAAGARKWQAERDAAKSELTNLSEEHASLKSDFSKLETAYSEGGLAGLVDLLEGQAGSYDSFIRKERERLEAYDSMSETDRAELVRQEQLSEQEKRNQELSTKYEEMLKKMESDKETAELRSIESKLHPSFDRYRFSGKLNDEVAETEFDEMLWNRAISRLESIPEGVDLTQAMIDKEFRAVASSMRKHMNAQVDSKVKKVMKKTKENATKKAQARVNKSLTSNAEVEQFKKDMRSGNVVDGLANFFKAGGKIR